MVPSFKLLQVFLLFCVSFALTQRKNIIASSMHTKTTIQTTYPHRLGTGEFKKRAVHFPSFFSIPASSNKDANPERQTTQNRNELLMEIFLHPNDNNLTEAINQNLNFCDESFDAYLTNCLDRSNTEEEKRPYGRIRYELNSVRQRKLMDADQLLRGVLAAGGLKQMEAKLAYHFRRGEIDMAFTVLLQLNIEDAMNSNSEQAAQVLMHLRTVIQEQQDALVPSPVRLLRMLLRTEDVNVRKQMLRQKLLITATQIATFKNNQNQGIESQAEATFSPQCESIVVQAVQTWGGAEVTVAALQSAIDDILVQVKQLGGDENMLQGFEENCEGLRREITEVVNETAPSTLV